MVRKITKNILGEAGDSLEIHLSPAATDIGSVLRKRTSSHFAKPGDLLEVLEGPSLSKAGTNSALVKDLRTGHVGIVWWAELKWSTYVVTTSAMPNYSQTRGGSFGPDPATW